MSGAGPRRSVLLVGASGVFGQRLAGLLSAFTDVELLLAARRLPALEALRDALRPAAQAWIDVQVFDRAHPETLMAIHPWLVIDAAGPFQDADYRLPLAAAAAGAHYIDLADARGFVAGFADAVGGAATAAGVLAVSGASSTPALSNAVLDELVRGWREVDTILVGISPGVRAPRGVSVIRAILAYVGRPVRVFADGAWRSRPGWSGLRREVFPGLGPRLLCLCETPDLDLLAARFAPRDNAVFTAGLELPVMHMGLWMLSWLVRWRLLRSLEPFAGALRWLADRLAPLGSDRGGMIVLAAGRDDKGRRVAARWALWAEDGAGPYTPVAPIAALARTLLDGTDTLPGAYPCVGVLGADAILSELAALPIHTRTQRALPDDAVLYRRLLGPVFEGLPKAVRIVHAGGRFDGEIVVRRGRSPVARFIAGLLGLPAPGRYPFAVEITADRRGEVWIRKFAGSQFRSRLQSGRRLGVLTESIGPLRFDMDLWPERHGVTWRLAGWSVAGCRLPRGLGPLVRAGQVERDGRYAFRVIVAHAWVGLLFAYQGTLQTPHGVAAP